MTETTEPQRFAETVAPEMAPGDYLIGLACGHFWPGHAESDKRAAELLAVFVVSGDTSRCSWCWRQERITGPLARVLPNDEVRA